MDVKQAAINTLKIWSKNFELPDKAIRNLTGDTLGHQRWLLEAVRDGVVDGDKAHRWLAFAQGYLVAEEVVSLNDCKYANVFS